MGPSCLEHVLHQDSCSNRHEKEATESLDYPQFLGGFEGQLTVGDMD